MLNQHDALLLGVQLSEAIHRLAGDALHEQLGIIAKFWVVSPAGRYSLAMPVAVTEGENRIQERVGTFGWYVLSDRADGYGEDEIAKLKALVELTNNLLMARQSSQMEMQQAAHVLELKNQMLDQIHESVITFDMAGFILSWNRGAEELFGYPGKEAIGRNILFLYEDENTDALPMFDEFLENGGREMEVRRRKKSGEIFWASLTLSPLVDKQGQVAGMIGYLNDITKRKEDQEQINRLAYFDSLTGLPNRTLFLKMVDKNLGMPQTGRLFGSVLHIDLDRFKVINDTLGHSAGDFLLKQVGERFRCCLRADDIVSRLGNDEFAVALYDINQESHAGLVAQKMLDSLEAPFLLDGHEVRIGASIGISFYPQDGDTAEKLLRKADIAMCRVQQGRETRGYSFFSHEMNKGALDRLHTEAGLRRALVNDELVLYYQPKISLQTGLIVGAEALVRWCDPHRGMVAPGEFIGVAEETGLIVQIGEWVLESACDQALSWKNAGMAPCRIAVNVSANEFSLALPARVAAALSKRQLEAEWLELEITESMLMHSADSVISIMEQIVNLGVRLSLDDFGTGYSSLSYLKRFPIYALQIDSSFVRGSPGDSSDRAMASAIISMAKQLHYKVIAEGVETPAQLAFLKQAGCDHMQGYLFSYPIVAARFEAMLRAEREGNSEAPALLAGIASAESVASNDVAPSEPIKPIKQIKYSRVMPCLVSSKR